MQEIPNIYFAALASLAYIRYQSLQLHNSILRMFLQPESRFGQIIQEIKFLLIVGDLLDSAYVRRIDHIMLVAYLARYQ